MNTMELLALVAGLSALAGLNLYLTVFAVGLAVRYDWVELPPAWSALEVLGHPAVLAVAGLMVVVEFIADKVPWVDTLWDGLHTLIRPLGAAMLSAGMAGPQDPVLAVVAGLLGGSVALTTHTGKAGLRLAANTSPEPFSNSVLSLLEDGIVLAGVWLIAVYPWVAAGLAVGVLLVAAWIVPWAVRCLRMHASLLLQWLRGPQGAESSALPLAWREALDRAVGPAGGALLRAEPAFAVGIRGVPDFRAGAAVALEGQVGWAGPRRAVLLPVEDLEVHVRQRLWFDEISWFSPSRRQGIAMRVGRGRGDRVAGWRLLAVRQKV